MKEKYIIFAYNSEGACMVRTMFGTREEVQDKVMEIIYQDKENDVTEWDMGTESAYDLEYDGDTNGFRGFNTFYDYSINYLGCPCNNITEIK